jgi:Tfp pilus tip-associated adhesin PilY1
MCIRKSQALIICITLFFLSLTSIASAQLGESELLTMTSTAPDVLLLIDLSGSMVWNPAGGTAIWGDSSCSGPFQSSSGGNYQTDCSRLAITKRAIFSILDDTQDGQIYSGTKSSTDDASLGVRIGYMSFQDCQTSSNEVKSPSVNDTYDSKGYYTTGCNQLRQPISTTSTSATKYSVIYCGNTTSCSIGTTCNSLSCINGASATGGTPLAAALFEAKLYLDWHKSQDTYKDCRNKFVILFTDGSDTFTCGADGAECGQNRYKNRREVVARAKELADTGYQLFVIGFGSAMPTYLQNTLNWMAYYGGTKNPDVTNSGDTSAYTLPLGCDPVTNSAACCVLNTTALATSTNPSACYPSGVTQCGVDSAPAAATCYDSSAGCGAGCSTSNFRAGSNDPGYLALSGYAFLASDTATLGAALKSAFTAIRWSTYSFTQASVQTSRTQDENFLYEASFDYIANDPFWHGHLKKFVINADGSVGTMVTDAADILQGTSYSSRTIYTAIAGSRTPFSTALDPSYFGYVSADTTDRNAVVGYVQGNPTFVPPAPNSIHDLDGNVFKLGDIFRSSPITVGTPSAFFNDYRDTGSSPNAFVTFRLNHCRSSSCPAPGYTGPNTRIIVVGANDGQLHAFKTSDMSEAWSFVPSNLLAKLKLVNHVKDPSGLNHQYFVDGPVTIQDVWIPSSSAQDGTSKSSSEWMTLLVLAEGRGGSPNLWSSSSTCDTGFNSVWSTSYPYYCGYYAFDVTNTISPVFKWHLGGISTLINAQKQAPYLGDPWSEMMTGRVWLSGKERWVGFIGGGYNANDCSGGGQCDARGKGFFVVDLSNGAIIWSYTMYDNPNKNGMLYSLPGTAAVVDTDNEGFIDTAYIGDLGGNMWRFKFCTRAMGTSCNTSSWTGGKLYDSSSGAIRPIYTMPTAAVDGAGNLWIYWGSGDKSDPTASNAQEKLYGLKDNDRTTTYGINDLTNITSTGKTYDNTTSSSDGYYINMTGGGEKILSDPTVFGGVVYFSTYTPPANKPCEQTGDASLYAIGYTSGGGAFTGGARSMSVGSGIPSSPIVSLKPGSSNIPDLYITTSGTGAKGDNSPKTQRIGFNPPGVTNRTNILFWRDQRLQ